MVTVWSAPPSLVHVTGTPAWTSATSGLKTQGPGMRMSWVATGSLADPVHPARKRRKRDAARMSFVGIRS